MKVRCFNCGRTIGHKESLTKGISDSLCEECFYWAAHFNRYRRLYEISPTTNTKRLMEICRKKLEQRKGVKDESNNPGNDYTFSITY